MDTDRIKEIQQKTAYPESVSVQQALLKVWNETVQEQLRIGAVSNSEAFEHYGKIMWEYKKQIIEIKDPSDYEIVSEMDKFGQDGWGIFSITEKVVEEYETYGEPHKTVKYTMYMKKLAE